MLVPQCFGLVLAAQGFFDGLAADPDPADSSTRGRRRRLHRAQRSSRIPQSQQAWVTGIVAQSARVSAAGRDGPGKLVAAHADVRQPAAQVYQKLTDPCDGDQEPRPSPYRLHTC